MFGESEDEMEQECGLLKKCGFFKKYQVTKDLACKGFIQRFCRGGKMDECKRMEYRLEHGTPPCDEMMPTGRMVVEKAGQKR